MWTKGSSTGIAPPPPPSPTCPPVGVSCWCLKNSWPKQPAARFSRIMLVRSTQRLLTLTLQHNLPSIWPWSDKPHWTVLLKPLVGWGELKKMKNIIVIIITIHGAAMCQARENMEMLLIAGKRANAINPLIPNSGSAWNFSFWCQCLIHQRGHENLRYDHPRWIP